MTYSEALANALAVSLYQQLMAPLYYAAHILESLGWIATDSKGNYRVTKLGNGYLNANGRITDEGHGILDAYLAGEKVRSMFTMFKK